MGKVLQMKRRRIASAQKSIQDAARTTWRVVTLQPVREAAQSIALQTNKRLMDAQTALNRVQKTARNTVGTTVSLVETVAALPATWERKQMETQQTIQSSWTAAEEAAEMTVQTVRTVWKILTLEAAR